MGLYGGLVAVVGCSLRPGRPRPGPPTPSARRRTRGSTAFTGSTRSTSSNAPAGSSWASSISAMADPPCPRPLLEVRQQLSGTQEVIARRVVRASTNRQRCCLEPDVSPRRLGLPLAARPARTMPSASLRSPTASSAIASRTAGNTVCPMTGRPRVVVAGMLEQAALVTLGPQQVQPVVVRAADGLGIARRHRVLPTDLAVEVGLLEVGLHRTADGADPMGLADGGRRPRAMCRGHGVLDEPTGLLGPPVPPHGVGELGQGFCVLAAVRIDTGQLHGSSHILGDTRCLAKGKCGSPPPTASACSPTAGRARGRPGHVPRGAGDSPPVPAPPTGRPRRRAPAAGHGRRCRWRRQPPPTGRPPGPAGRRPREARRASRRGRRLGGAR